MVFVPTGQSLKSFLGLTQTQSTLCGKALPPIDRSAIFKKAKKERDSKKASHKIRILQTAKELSFDGKQATIEDMRMCEFYIRKIRSNDAPFGGLRVMILGADASVCKEDRWGFQMEDGVATNTA